MFRFVHYGSCLFRNAFDTPEFKSSKFCGLPVQISSVWRREISALQSDWETLSVASERFPASAFAETWIAPKATFENADLILADLVLDIFQPTALRLRREGEENLTPYSRIVSNFPDEPPAELVSELGAFPSTAQASLDAWQRFGNSIKTPAVFVTLENRDDIKPGYGPTTRQRLLAYQAQFSELAQQFPHWLVVSLDDIFSDPGAACYVDRHHPTPLGWSLFRERLPARIQESGILRVKLGGKSVQTRNWNIPERCDFENLDLEHIQRLSAFKGPACAIGPARLTKVVAEAFGGSISEYDSFSPLSGNPNSPDLIVVLKWNQPTKLPPWMGSLVRQHPTSLIEIPSLWEGREGFIISREEKALRENLKQFGQQHAHACIRLPDIDRHLRRYISRCLFTTHRPDQTLTWLVPDLPSGRDLCSLPEQFSSSVSSIPLMPVFGQYS